MSFRSAITGRYIRKAAARRWPNSSVSQRTNAQVIELAARADERAKIIEEIRNADDLTVTREQRETIAIYIKAMG